MVEPITITIKGAKNLTDSVEVIIDTNRGLQGGPKKRMEKVLCAKREIKIT